MNNMRQTYKKIVSHPVLSAYMSVYALQGVGAKDIHNRAGEISILCSPSTLVPVSSRHPYGSMLCLDYPIG